MSTCPDKHLWRYFRESDGVFICDRCDARRRDVYSTPRCTCDGGRVGALVASLERKAIAYHAHMLHWATFAGCAVPTCEEDRATIESAKAGA